MFKPTILYITELFPYPPDSGAKIKSINTIQTLSKKFNIVLISFAETRVLAKDLVAIKKFVKQTKVFYLPELSQPPQENLSKLIKNYLHLKPFFFYQTFSPSAKQFVDKLIKKVRPAVIHIDHLAMSQYLPQEKKQIWVYEEHNLESELAWQRFSAYQPLNKTKFHLWLEFLMIALHENRLILKFDHIFTISQADAQHLRKIANNIEISNQPPIYLAKSIKKTKMSKQPSRILFIGDMTWHPNQEAVTWFTSKIFPLILKKQPDVCLDLVGKIDDELVSKILKTNQIKIWGYQKSLTKFLNEGNVFVMPFKVGGGVRIKALTAMSAGIPIVTTKIGARGLGGKIGQTYLVAESEQQFAKACLKLLADQKLSLKIAQAGVEYLRNNHHPDNNAKFLAEYQALL